MNTISVLLPAFDAEATLPACLRSVQRQSETGWECIVVDDGSRDGTGDVARSFAGRDPRFRVVSTPHRGLAPALRTGLEHCRGRYVARMDADDLMHRHRLAEQLRALEAAPNLAAVGCHVRLFPRRALPEGRRDYEHWLNRIDSEKRLRREAFIECPVAHPTLTIRGEVLSEMSYRDVDWPEDYDLVLRLLGRAYEIGVVPKRLLSWRDTPTRLSRTDERYSLERFTSCKAAFLAAGFLAGTEEYVLWGYGSTGKSMCRALLAHGKTLSHVVEVHPGRLGMTIHGAPVIRPGGLLSIPRRPVVVSVAGEEPRAEIRDAMEKMRFRELTDFVCAA